MSSTDALGHLAVAIIGIVIFLVAYDHYRGKSVKVVKGSGKDELRAFIGIKKDWILAAVFIVFFTWSCMPC